MERRALGAGGPSLPVVGLGTWKVFDVRGASEEEARHGVVREALAAGTTVFDSSPMYGEAERVLGAGLAGRREQAFVATKVWAKDPAQAEAQIAASLAFYGGTIDLYQVHNLSLLDYVLPRLKELRSTGQVKRIGLTHYDPAHFDELEAAMVRGDVDAVQLPLNVQARGAQARLLPRAEELGLGVLVMQPLATGRLVGRPPPAGLVESYAHRGVRSWAQLLLKWVLSDPRVDVILPATSNPGRAVENAQAGAPPWLDDEERDRLARAVADAR